MMRTGTADLRAWLDEQDDEWMRYEEIHGQHGSAREATDTLKELRQLVKDGELEEKSIGTRPHFRARH